MSRWFQILLTNRLTWMRTSPLVQACVLAACLSLGSVPLAHAQDDSGPKAAPRSAFAIGAASVVLVALPDKLYAFVDRLEDNAPVRDAQLSVQTEDGTEIPMTKAPPTANGENDGLFVGPLKRAGQMQGAFMVSLRSAEGTGEKPTEIAYTDVQSDQPGSASGGANLTTKFAIAMVSGAIGAIGAALFVFWWLGGGRGQRAAQSVGTGHLA